MWTFSRWTVKFIPRKCGQFDKSVDNFVHTFCQIRKQCFTWTMNYFSECMDNFVHTFYQIRKQCFMWTVNSFLESVDNLIKVWTILSTLSVRYVNSVLCEQWTLSQKVWKIWTKCGQNYPHLKSNGKQYT